MPTQIVYSDIFQKHNNPFHPENAERTNAMITELQQTPFYEKLEFIEPWLLPEQLLYTVHADFMIQQVKNLSEIGDAWLDPDTYVCKNDYTTARLAAGGLLQLCKNVLYEETDNGVALIRPPGHHATRNRSMGFCLFNNAALAAQFLMEQGNRVLIFDHDVHHGNGTQDIFYENDKVLYQSFHLSPHYPGTGDADEIGVGDGIGYTVNAPLHHGNGETMVTKLLQEIFLPIAEQFHPDIIIVSSGFDSHHADQLGGLQLTANFYGEIIKQFQTIQRRIVCTLEGGYNLQWIGKCLISLVGQLCGHPVQVEDHANERNTSEDIIKALKKRMKEFWGI